MKNIVLFVTYLMGSSVSAQNFGILTGQVMEANQSVPFASVALKGTQFGAVADSLGRFRLEKIPAGTYTLMASALGFKPFRQDLVVRTGKTTEARIHLISESGQLEEVVVTGTMKEVSKLASPVPVDLIPQKFLYKNPTPSIFESLSYVNGVRPQVNCNVCNTGDIHINGLEGPYTMVMIDGMPIVSGLSTVYGLNGIPTSLIDRVEIVKGPASSLYGSEAVGGLINIITKPVEKAPVLSADVFSSNWLDYSVDFSSKFKVADKAYSLLGINYFNYQNPVDNNGDGFTDLTLQNRISIFNKWAFNRPQHRLASLAVRYLYEDRWGGQAQWSRADRGGDEVYGESIYTRRWEVLGSYQLPFKERLMLHYSFNSHNQNSYYGITPYMATQRIAFAQLVWDKSIGKQSLLAGIPFRYTYYNDNTPATRSEQGVDKADHIFLPGVFIQDEITAGVHKFLLGARYDYNSRHGNIFTPRAAYKLEFNRTDALRFNVGSGFRVVNLFTEDHAALTGAREVVITEALKPEKSWNANLNFIKKIVIGNSFIGLDASLFYTRFSNRIVPDYETNPQQIIYDNLKGHAISKGISLNLDINLLIPLKVNLGTTLMDNRVVENGKNFRPILTERLMGTWALSYTWDRIGVTFDYTGNLIGPMRLPVLGATDPRAANSPFWSIQNIQLVKALGNRWEIYGGVKNLLNFRPPANSIARAHDPFDKNVQFDSDGTVIKTPENPYGLTFDPSYVYAPNQGIRGFLGLRYTLR